MSEGDSRGIGTRTTHGRAQIKTLFAHVNVAIKWQSEHVAWWLCRGNTAAIKESRERLSVEQDIIMYFLVVLFQSKGMFAPFLQGKLPRTQKA